MRDSAFDFARSEDRDVTSDAKIERLHAAYVAKARKLGAGDTALEAIESFFSTISTEIRQVEQARRAAVPSHLLALEAFAARAYRRPLSENERAKLLAFYQRLRDQEGLDHEDALRDTRIAQPAIGAVGVPQVGLPVLGSMKDGPTAFCSCWNSR